MINLVDAGDDRDLLCSAAEHVIKTQRADPRTLQRKIRVGFVKAGTLMLLLEDAGVVAWTEAGAREVLVPRDQKLAAVDAIRKGVTL